MYGILHTEWSKGWGGQGIRIIQESLHFMKRGYRMMIACQPGSTIHKAAKEKGIPVISTFAGGIEEVVMNGQTGTLIPPGDARALSEAIYWAYQNREESMKMARRARESILKDFTVTRMIEKAEKVYEEILGSAHRERIPSAGRGFIASVLSSSK